MSKEQVENFEDKMRAASALAAATLDMIGEYVQPGVTTEKLNQICEDYMRERGGNPAPLTKGFPKAVCTSPNRVICHGIPNDKPLKSGDILNIDVSLEKDGVFGDTCKMYFVGKPTVQGQRIVQCAKECLYAAIAVVKPGQAFSEIGKIIEKQAKKYRYAVVRDFCGHGIGTMLHGGVQVLHFYDPKYDDRFMEEGMTFTIEPMINCGSAGVKMLKDGWTAVTKDRSLSAQYEHTLLVTKTGVEVLSLREDESMEAILSAV